MSDQNVGAGIYEVKWTFTREELRELGLRLAGKTQEQYNATAARKAANAAASAHIQGINDDISKLVQKLNQLWELREMECKIYYHTPQHGYKTIIRPDNNEPIRDPEPMSAAEMQSSFVFIDEAPKDKPKPQ